MALDAALNALAQGFQVSLDSSQAANRLFTARLVPPPGSLNDKGQLSITDLVTTVQAVPSAVDLSWRTKNVRFVETDITDGTLLGGMPINDLLALNVGNVTSGATTPPGIPGLIGALAGTIPLPLEVTQPQLFTVGVDVRWRVRDGAQPVTDVQWTVGSASGSGGDILSPAGSGLDPLTLTFDLLFTELTGDAAPTVSRTLTASIRLQAGNVSTPWIDLPPLSLTLPAIPVPTVALFCQDTDFGSNKLIVVPASSPLDSGTFQGALTTLRDTLAPLRTTASFLGLFLDSFDTVSNLLQNGNIVFRKADEIGNLNDIDLESGFWNDTEAEDELSSMVLIGPPRRRVQCFNARNFSTSEGEMDLTLKHELIALVRNLHSASPVSDPPGCVSVPFTPHGSRWSGVDPWSDITSFGDQFSSIRFAWAP